jgi:hypothetical protein
MSPPQNLDEWRKAYRDRVEALETQRLRELSEMTDERALQIIMSLKVEGTPWRERPDWSGLVEQQRLFMRGMKK